MGIGQVSIQFWIICCLRYSHWYTPVLGAKNSILTNHAEFGNRSSTSYQLHCSEPVPSPETMLDVSDPREQTPLLNDGNRSRSPLEGRALHRSEGDGQGEQCTCFGHVSSPISRRKGQHGEGYANVPKIRRQLGRQLLNHISKFI